MNNHRRQTLCLFVLMILLISGIARPQAAESNTSYIDEHNRFILNGKPFFPLGLYVMCLAQPFPDTDELDVIADSPFDTVMHYSTATATNPEITDFLAALQDQDRDLKLIFSLYKKGCDDNNTVCEMEIPFPTTSDFESFIEDKVKNFGGDPIGEPVIAWYLNDEICPVCLGRGYLDAGYNKIRELDASRPVWSVHWNFIGPNSWLVQEAHTTDIVGVDPHTDHQNPVTLTANMADAATATGKPLWLAPQINRDTATPANMRAMTYIAVNHGAKGLIYYCYSALDDTKWQQIQEIASEIDQLRPVFLSIEQTNDNDITCNNSSIDFKFMKKGDTYYLFGVNTEETDVTGVSFEINLTRKPSAFETMFEGDRQISVVNGKITDDFGVYEVHVYYWEEPDSDGGEGGSNGSSGGTCFIATAVFGSYVDPHVQVIRDFRDEYLLTHMPGRWFVRMYNTYGPLGADLLNAHPWCKPFVRLAFMPLVGSSYFLVKTSLATKLLTGFLLGAFIVTFALRIRGGSLTNE